MFWAKDYTWRTRLLMPRDLLKTENIKEPTLAPITPQRLSNIRLSPEYK